MALATICLFLPPTLDLIQHNAQKGSSEAKTT
jgi:hypothetical protein